MMVMMTNNSDDDDDDGGDNINSDYLPIWAIVDEKKMITTGSILSILHCHDYHHHHHGYDVRIFIFFIHLL
jgi:hypothetical protein